MQNVLPTTTCCIMINHDVNFLDIVKSSPPCILFNIITTSSLNSLITKDLVCTFQSDVGGGSIVGVGGGSQ